MWKTILDFAIENQYIILGTLSLILYVIFETQKAKEKLVELMLLAKDKAKDGILKSGKEQEDYVVAIAYKILPQRITMFLSNDLMHKIVHHIYVAIKDKVDDGKWNGSIE
jgi:hypothetical protein